MSEVTALSKEALRNPCVTVVVPVWNPGPGIDACIASLLGQTLPHFEAVFVDDRGDGGAMGAVRAAAARDPRVRVIENPENLGAGPSRNAGIEAARGRYLAFLDADDRLAPDFLELLWDRARLSGFPDIVKGTVRYIEPGADADETTVDSAGDVVQNALATGLPLWCAFMYGHQSAIYKRDILVASGARYGTSRNSQDDTFLLRACHAAKSIEFERRATYCYVRRDGSATQIFTPQRLENQMCAIHEQFDYLVERLADDPYARKYGWMKTQFLLGILAYCFGQPDMRWDEERFIGALKGEVERLPFCDELEEEHLGAFALVEDGAVLPDKPFSPFWHKEGGTLQSYRELVAAWVKYVDAHPLLSRRHLECAQRVVETALFLCAREVNDTGGDPQLHSLLAYLMAQRARVAQRVASCS